MMITWDERAVETFKKMWNAGATYQKIGERFGVTKGAVSRQCCRLGLKRREENSPERKAELKKARDLRAIQAKRDKRSSAIGAQVQAINRAPKISPEPFVCARAASVEPRCISLQDFTENTCKYDCSGQDDVQKFAFCGHQTLTGHPWCAAHARIVYNPQAERKRAA